MVMPGCCWTKDSACAARVPLPLRRPALRRGPPRLAGAAVAVAAGAAAFLAVLEPLGRPGPRRPPAFLAGAAAGAALDLAAVAEAPPTPSSAEAAASRR